MVLWSGLLSTGVFVLASYHAGRKPGVAGRQESGLWRHATALANPFLLLESVLAIADLKKAEPPTILAWDFRGRSLTLDRERENPPWVTIWNG
jgi:hypothetical protein